jgi:type III secretion protein W
MGIGDFARSLRADTAKMFAAESLVGGEVIEKAEEAIASFENAEAEETSVHLQEFFEDTAAPIIGAFRKREETLKERSVKRSEQVVKPDEVPKVVPDRTAKDAASKFEKRNPEEPKLSQASLLNLLKLAKDCKSKEDLLSLLEKLDMDPFLASDALDFLSETTLGDLNKIVQEARNELKTNNEIAIKSGLNTIGEVSRTAGRDSTERLKLRGHLTELLQNSETRDAGTLFLDYSKQFPSYKEMRRIFAFFYRALGADLKSQGPSIEKGLLHVLMQEVRKAQAGIGLYTFFRDRMPLIQKAFERNGVPLPPDLTFEKMTTSFLKLLSERYPSSEKVLDSIPFAKILDILGKIVILNQFRDAMPQTSSTFLFRSDQHKDELKNSILSTLEHFEEELEEQEEGDWGEEDNFDSPQQENQKTEGPGIVK